jgi:hypothetical protein
MLPMSDNDHLLTLQDVADYCDVPELVVHRWITKRRLVVCFTADGEHRFRMIDVRAALEAHHQASGSTTFILGKLKRPNGKSKR